MTAAATATAPLLVELLVEELPPKALASLGQAFADGLVGSLRAQGLAAADAAVTPYATPRRLAVLVEGVARRAADRAQSVKLMPAAVGFDADGKPTPALRKKLASLGAADAFSRLCRKADGKAESLFLDTVVPGPTLDAGLQRALDETLARLPVPKAMQYQLADGWTSVGFVRPAHGLVALHGDAVVPVRALGLEAGRLTRGHRFEARSDPIELREAAAYADQLRDEGAVLASFAGRRAEIRRQLAAAAARESGLVAIDDPALLDEVAGLVERPFVVACSFDRDFLAVPAECLVLTMKANQKYFPLLDGEGRLSNRFLVVANIRPADPSRIVEGNERVVRPRLADARFFFEQDARRSLGSRVPELDRVVYHARLGSQGDRVRRLRAIGGWLAEATGIAAAPLDRALELAKADLLTDMVGEFPELQGIMGAYYAANDGEAEAVVEAIREQYVHARADDAAPLRPLAEALRIADRAEALVGLWGVGGKPTGEKDPYALRRAALVLIRAFERLAGETRAGRPLLDLQALLEAAAASFAAGTLHPATVEEATAFVYERLANQLAAGGADPRAVDAVLAPRPPLGDVARRLEAVLAFRGLPESEALAAANKRVANILRKADAGAAAAAVDPDRYTEPAERALHEALRRTAAEADARFLAGDYAGSLTALAALRAPVDAFFDDVLVNADDPDVRANRLALLARLHAGMNRIADLSRLAA